MNQEKYTEKYTKEQLEAFDELDKISMEFLCPRLSGHPLFPKMKEVLTDQELMMIDEWISNADYYRNIQPKALWRSPLDQAEYSIHHKKIQIIDLLSSNKKSKFNQFAEYFKSYKESEHRYFSLKREKKMKDIVEGNYAK